MAKWIHFHIHCLLHRHGHMHLHSIFLSIIFRSHSLGVRIKLLARSIFLSISIVILFTVMANGTQQPSDEQRFKARDFQYHPSTPLHNEPQSGRAPPLGLPTEQERKRTSEMLSIAPPPSAGTECRGRTKLSQRQESESYKCGVDQIPDCRYRSHSVEDVEDGEQELELKTTKRVLKAKPLNDLDDHLPTQQPKARPAPRLNPYEDAILNPILPPLPDVPRSTPTQSKQSTSLPTQPKPLATNQQPDPKPIEHRHDDSDTTWFPPSSSRSSPPHHRPSSPAPSPKKQITSLSPPSAPHSFPCSTPSAPPRCRTARSKPAPQNSCVSLRLPGSRCAGSIAGARIRAGIGF